MGQYYGQRKIGTCESMYYMRMSEAKELARIGAKDNDGIPFADYLKDNVTRWRFPFPEEDLLDPDQQEIDGGDIAAMQHAYNKGFSIPAGPVEMNHGTICQHNAHEDKSHGVNIIMPCPNDPKFRDLLMAGVKLSTGGAGEPFLSVMYTAMRKDHDTGPMREKTIFACARCGAQQRFDDADVVKIKERAMEYFKPYDTTGKNEGYHGNQGLYDYAMKILDRIK